MPDSTTTTTTTAGHDSAGTAPPIAAYTEIREARAPAVSGDGGSIAFLWNRTGFNQIWAMPPGGAPRQLTDMPEIVGALAFRPETDDILFTTDDGGDERHRFWLLPAGGGTPRALTDDPTVLHNWGCWSADGARIAYSANVRDKTCMDVWVMDIASGAATCVLETQGWVEPLAFTRDGASLLLRDSTVSNNDQQLALLEIASGRVTPLMPQSGRARYLAARMLKDESGFLVICDQEHEFHSLLKYSFATGAVETLAALDGQDIETVTLSPDQSHAVLVSNDGGISRLYRTADLSADTALTELAVPGQGVIAGMNWMPDGAALVFPYESPLSPAAIWKLELATGACARISPESTGQGPLPPFTAPVLETVESFDGLKVPMFVYTPPGKPPEAGWPVLFWVHGGPEGQFRPNFVSEIQYLVAQGIVVVGPNVRGSTGYGRAYNEADDREKRLDSVADLAAQARAMAARPGIDASRIGVMGRSYGGFMVLSAVTEYPELWKTSVNYFGVANFLTMLECTGPYRRRLRVAEYGDPETMTPELIRFSPIHRIARCRVPMFLAHAGNDPRVPPGETEMVYSCLRGLGKPVELVRIDHAGHGFFRLDQRHRVNGPLADFIARTL